MKYFTINGLTYHCDSMYRYATTDKDRCVYLHLSKPSLHIEVGFWDSSGCFQVQDILDESTTPWTESCKELV